MNEMTPQEPMPLQLNFRDVARANIERFDDLGAFSGKSTCEYHYGDGKHCAIGVCDPTGILSDDISRIAGYVNSGKVRTDSAEMLMFIQALHDYRASPDLSCRDDITPDLYKKIMGLIAALPA